MPTLNEYHQGTGEPLVLLHGFSDTWQGWAPILPTLSAHHEVFAWSLPGHLGGPPWDHSTPFSFSTFADAVELQLDAHGLSRVHLAGNSLGGWLSIELAARGRALSVVGVCPAGGWEPHGRQERRIKRYFRRNQLLLRYATRVLPLVAHQTTLRRFALRDLVADGRKVPPDAALGLFLGAQQCAVVDEVLSLTGSANIFAVGPIESPIRILYGSKDRLLRWPSCYVTMQRRLPDADWVCLEGLGHLPMWDAPDLVARAILEHTRPNLGQPDVESPRSA